MARPKVAATPTSCGRSRVPGCKRHLARAHVLAGAAPVRAALHAGRDDHDVAVQLDVLLHQRGVGACGHGRAGQHPERRARRETAREGMAGGGAPGPELEAGRPVGREIGMGEGEAVDGDVVEAGHVARAHQRFGENAAVRLGERNALAVHDRADPRLQQLERLGRREPLGLVREAVVDQSPCHATCRHSPGSDAKR